LIFAAQRCILYPEQKIVVVAPTKPQSSRFVKKVQELSQKSPNLAAEIAKVKVGENESKIIFHNGSEIITVPHSENALGARCHILIVDEFVRTDQDILTRVFRPFLTNQRLPPYRELSKTERSEYGLNEKTKEPNRQIYLSSIRRADEWSYQYFLKYIKKMLKGSSAYTSVALPYNFGVKNGFITPDTVKQSFEENTDGIDILLAEYKCIPEKLIGNSFYKWDAIDKCRDTEKPMVCMSDEEFIKYKDSKSSFPYWTEKQPNEIRILSMDIALVESVRNDNTAFWILRLIPDGNGKYKRKFHFAESLHGINAKIQALRVKQLFYEFDCDYCVMDTQGVGMGVFDICTEETYDNHRGVEYPAWTVTNPDDISKNTRVISENAVPVVYSITTGAEAKSRILVHSREILETGLVSFLVEKEDAMDYLNKHFKYFKLIDEHDLRRRISTPFAQTNQFVNEAINLEQIIVAGRFSAKEKGGRRKDRVMSYAYALDLASKLELELIDSNYNILDYILAM
jgi:hypothetical protein